MALGETFGGAIKRVSIPKRVSEVLWQMLGNSRKLCHLQFQSLKGFQRFCGIGAPIGVAVKPSVSIPKRVSEVLWPKLC